MKVLIRYGELFLKSESVKKKMIAQLVSNIKAGLPHASIKTKRGRIIADVDFNQAKPILKRVFGIVSFSPSYTVESNMMAIKEQSLKLIDANKTFAIRTNRPYKKFPLTSQEVSREVGAYIVENTGAKVDLKNPQQTINIEIFGDETFIFTETFKGIGGLPLGVSGTLGLECNNTYDVLAGLMMMKRGCTLVVKGNKSNILEQWSIGKPITYVNTFKHCKALVSGALDFKAIKKHDIPVFYPLIALPDWKLSELRKAFYLE